MSTSIYDAMNAAQATSTNLTGSMLGAQNASSIQFRTAEERLPRDKSMVGVFKILRAEDGFIVRCAVDEGYAHKTYVANDIDEALNKAKVYLVTEALNK